MNTVKEQTLYWYVHSYITLPNVILYNENVFHKEKQTYVIITLRMLVLVFSALIKHSKKLDVKAVRM